MLLVPSALLTTEASVTPSWSRSTFISVEDSVPSTVTAGSSSLVTFGSLPPVSSTYIALHPLWYRHSPPARCQRQMWLPLGRCGSRSQPASATQAGPHLRQHLLGLRACLVHRGQFLTDRAQLLGLLHRGHFQRFVDLLQLGLDGLDPFGQRLLQRHVQLVLGLDQLLLHQLIHRGTSVGDGVGEPRLDVLLVRRVLARAADPPPGAEPD